MEILNLKKMGSEMDKERTRVFFEHEGSKMRMISLRKGEGIPTCQMASYVVFQVLEGRVEVNVNGTGHDLPEGYCLISEPARISMMSLEDSRIIGIQISSDKRE